MSGPVANEASSGDIDEMFPVVSTLDRRAARLTQLLPGRPVGRFTGRLCAKALFAVVGWALVFSVPCAAFLGVAPESVGSAWAIVPALVVGYLVLSTTLGLSEQVRTAFGQVRLPGLLASTVIWGAFALTALGWSAASFASDPEPAFDLDNIVTSSSLPRELLALAAGAAALWAVFAAVRLALAVRHARSRQETIDRLRRNGTRHAGVLSERAFLNTWLYDKPEFRIQVAYRDRGVERVVPAVIRTTPSQVPVVGSPMVVFIDEVGTVHVDPDHSSGLEYEADQRPFEPSDG